MVDKQPLLLNMFEIMLSMVNDCIQTFNIMIMLLCYVSISFVYIVSSSRDKKRLVYLKLFMT